MSIWDNIPYKLRSIFDDGLDEVLIFAVVFIFILITGHENKGFGEIEENAGILPLLVIAAFLLIFTSYCRSGDEQPGEETG